MTSSISDIRQSPAQEMVCFPASFAQQSLWFIDQLTPERATYNIPGALRIRGKLEVEVLERTLGEVVRRHETLRTRFVAVRGEPLQVIEEQVNVRLPVLDLSSVVGEEEREGEAQRLAQAEAQEPFHLQEAPLFRARLLRLGEQDHVLLFTLHHIVSDAWSTGVMIEEVTVLYEALRKGRPSPLAELGIQYVDYSEWQREWLEGGALEEQLGYWKEQLGGVSVLRLPTDRPRPTAQSEKGAGQEFVIAAEVVEKLKRVGEAQGATLFMVLLAAFQTLLYRYSGQDDIAVGTPVAGRTRRETEKLIGFFVNTLVLRVNLSGRPTFAELLRRTKEVTLEAYEHQDVPFEKLVEVLSPERNLGSMPLFQVGIGLQNAPRGDLRLGEAKLEPFSVDNETSKFDLLLMHAEDGSGMLWNSLTYSTDLFDSATITRMIGHYTTMLRGMAADPHTPIHALEMLSAEERRLVLEDFNATAASVPETTVVQLFEDQVERTPHATAARSGEDSMSYRELDHRANQLAHHLREMGVGPEMLVGICLNRSLDMVVALLGVLKSGGAYVPLDPAYPVERLGFMLEDAQIAVLVTESGLRGSLPTGMVQIVSMDEDWKDICANPLDKVEGRIDHSNLAYVIYTSGSTGQPKGVGVTHRGMVNYVNWASQTYKASQGSGSPVHSSLAFDLTVTSIYPALLNGGCLEVLPQSAGMEEMAQQLESSDYTLLKLTPSHLRMLSLLLAKSEKGEQGARTFVIGGEALKYADLELWRKTEPRTRLINEYGPTETVVGSTIYEVEDEREPGDVPVGKPIANTQIYILGREMEALPVGQSGELYIAGAGLARGYVNRPGLTAERFIPNPYGEPGTRMYRTGDLARWRRDGNLEYLGRNDQQVKIRGFRIELGEIEAMLESHSSVAQSVVLAREDQPGENRLVAYVAKRPGIANVDVSVLQEYLKVRLPEYMVPTVYVEVEKWPLNHNGKIERNKLPRPGLEMTSQEYVGPRNVTEEALCRIWEEVLRRQRVGIDDNFFSLGGHSLLAVQVAARLRVSFNVEVPIRVLFEAPTVATMAKYIANVTEGRVQSSPALVSIQPQGTRDPLFFVHAVGGQVMSYVELSRELGWEQPFYGLQSPPKDFFLGSAPTVEQMATFYIREALTVQPHGPYMLGAWSMGGLVAWEMAQQLTKQGERVKLLAIIDTIPPSTYRVADENPDEFSMLARFAVSMSRLIGRDPQPMEKQFLLLAPQDQWKMVQEALTSYGVLSSQTAYAEMAALLDVFTRNFLAGKSYIADPGGHEVVFFRASETEDHVVRPWTTLAGGGVQFHSVPGDHFTILKQPTVRLIADLLKEHISKADEGALQLSALSSETRL